MSLKSKWMDAAVRSTLTGGMLGAVAGYITLNPLVAVFSACAAGGYEFYQQAKAIKSDNNDPSID